MTNSDLEKLKNDLLMCTKAARYHEIQYNRMTSRAVELALAIERIEGRPAAEIPVQVASTADESARAVTDLAGCAVYTHPNTERLMPPESEAE